jgi:hypothetical protein
VWFACNSLFGFAFPLKSCDVMCVFCQPAPSRNCSLDLDPGSSPACHPGAYTPCLPACLACPPAGHHCPDHRGRARAGCPRQRRRQVQGVTQGGAEDAGTGWGILRGASGFLEMAQ